MAGNTSIYGVLPDIVRLSNNVIRIMGGNPGKFTLQGSNTYLIGTGKGRILIDTGVGLPHWINSLQKVLNDEQCSISICLLTHWHHDHVGGVTDLLKLSPNTKVYKYDPSENQLPIKDQQVFTCEGVNLISHHTPGHTKDHMCFLFKEETALFMGDNVLGHGTSVFEHLATYISSLHKMKDIQVSEGPGYPGHGEVIQNCKKEIAHYITHRETRERQVIGVMKKAEAEAERPSHYHGFITPMEIARMIYPEIDAELYSAAEKNCIEVLKKLEEESVVVRDGERWILKGNIRSTI